VPDELLSAYLAMPEDYAPAVRSAVEAHLAGCDTCRTALAQLSGLVLALHALPEVAPARSFVLTPALLGEAAPAPRTVRESAVVRQPGFLDRAAAWAYDHLNTVRWATGAAAMLFVAVLAVDLMAHAGTSGGDDDDDSAAMMPASAVTSTSAGAAAGTDQTLTYATGATAETAQDAQPTVAAPASTPAAQTTPVGTTDRNSGTGGEATATTGTGAADQPTQTAQATSAEPTAQAATGATPTPSDDSANTTPEGTPEALTQAEEPPTAASDADQEPIAVAAEEDGRSNWRLIEFGLALAFAWLLAALIVIPRLAARRIR
jgi:hypothetical protein